MTLLGVLMGDLVASEQTEDAAALHGCFNKAVDEANHRFPMVSPLTITLGDEFQGLTGDLRTAAQIARHLRLDLLTRSVDCRFVIGRVRLNTPLNPERAWNMTGHGLARARELLNAKQDLSLYTFSLPDDSLHERTLTAIGAALTGIERSWQRRQPADMAAAFEGLDVDAIAHRRGVSSHTVYKVRAAVKYELYSTLWSTVESTLAELDPRPYP